MMHRSSKGLEGQTSSSCLFALACDTSWVGEVKGGEDDVNKVFVLYYRMCLLGYFTHPSKPFKVRPRRVKP
jgi:hypothetical protein